jgi:hypothetical protein
LPAVYIESPRFSQFFALLVVTSALFVVVETVAAA